MDGSSAEQPNVTHRTLNENSSERRLHKSNIRSYKRSRAPRLRWSSELHQKFEKAVESLGGVERATPKMVLQIMNVNGVTASNIKSHLQFSRLMKKKASLKEGNVVEGAIANSSSNHAPSTHQDRESYNDGPVEVTINQVYAKEPPATMLIPHQKGDHEDVNGNLESPEGSYACSSKASSVDVKNHVSLELTLGYPIT